MSKKINKAGSAAVKSPNVNVDASKSVQKTETNGAQKKSEKPGSGKPAQGRPNKPLQNKGNDKPSSGRPRPVSTTLKPLPIVFANEGIVKQALSLDYKAISSLTLSEYTERNLFQYTVAIELWATLVEDIVSTQASRILLSDIAMSGLIGAIRHATTVSDLYIGAISKQEALDAGYYNEFGAFMSIIQLYDTLHDRDDALVLQALRFLKRFTPIGADKLYDEAYTKFDKLQDNLSKIPYRGTMRSVYGDDEWKIKNYSEPSIVSYWKPDRSDFVSPSGVYNKNGLSMSDPVDHLSGVRIETRYNYYWSDTAPERRYVYDKCYGCHSRLFLDVLYRVREQFARDRYDIGVCDSDTDIMRLAYQLGDFSNGSSQDGKTLEDKVQAFAAVEPQLYGVPFAPSKRVPWELDKYIITLQGVPKNWKTPRLIGPEAAYPNWWLTGLRRLFKLNYNCKDFDSEDQDVNRVLCKIASLDRRYATVDHSSASDAISKYIAEHVISEPWCKAIRRFRARKYTHPRMSGTRVLKTYLTSGNPLTFEFEGEFFLALAKVATEDAAWWLGNKRPAKLLRPKTFGDDLLIDSRAVDTYLSYAEMFGLSVNEEKSFVGLDAHFRESCGVEFIDGYPTKSVYWPRKELKAETDADAIMSLVSLQRRLMSVSLTAHTRMAGIVLALCPEMTSTGYYEQEAFIPDGYDSYTVDWEQTTDLLSPVSNHPYSKPPYKRVADEGQRLPSPDLLDRLKRRKHTGIVTKYPETNQSNNLQAYLYALWLRKGPQYVDNTMRDCKATLKVDKNSYSSTGSQILKRITQ